MATSKKNANGAGAKSSAPQPRPASGAKPSAGPKASTKAAPGKVAAGKSASPAGAAVKPAAKSASPAPATAKGAPGVKGNGPAKPAIAGLPAKSAKPAAGKKGGLSKADSVARKAAAAQARAEVAWDKATAKAAEVGGGARKLPKGGPSKADLRRYRDLLLEKRRSLLSSSKELAAEALQAGGGEFSVDHMADHGSDNYEQDFNLKLLEGESEQLAEVRDALLKIDGKSDLPFGACEACADEDQKLCPTCPWIPATRLDALPWARLCVQTKALEEGKKG